MATPAPGGEGRGEGGRETFFKATVWRVTPCAPSGKSERGRSNRRFAEDCEPYQQREASGVRMALAPLPDGTLFAEE